jgi:hypothetical protein
MQHVEIFDASLERLAPPKHAWVGPSASKTAHCQTRPVLPPPRRYVAACDSPVIFDGQWGKVPMTCVLLCIRRDFIAATCPAQICSGHGDCIGLPGFCSCRSGYNGAACQLCARGHIRVGSACVFMPSALTSCEDGVRNGAEEGVDCGGPSCGACSDTSLSFTTKNTKVR